MILPKYLLSVISILFELLCIYFSFVSYILFPAYLAIGILNNDICIKGFGMRRSPKSHSVHIQVSTCQKYRILSCEQLKNANYEVSSLFYGTERFQIQNHFQSLLDLVDLNNENGGLVFDLIIMSASSLQEIPQVLRDIKPMMNKTTKILFESSGFIYLEPFIKASVDLSLSNIFSIFTDYDIRRLDNGSYKQFTTANAKSFSVSIGQTTSVHENSYSSDIIPILNTFQKLFQNCFLGTL